VLPPRTKECLVEQLTGVEHDGACVVDELRADRGLAYMVSGLRHDRDHVGRCRRIRRILS
jgi:hypothetical protein